MKVDLYNVIETLRSGGLNLVFKPKPHKQREEEYRHGFSILAKEIRIARETIAAFEKDALGTHISWFQEAKRLAKLTPEGQEIEMLLEKESN